MLFGHDVLAALEEGANLPEETRSSFWQEELDGFSFHANGEMTGLISIGSISYKTKWYHNLAHYLLQAPYRWTGSRYKEFSNTDALGKKIAEGQGRQYSLDMMRQSLALAALDSRAQIGTVDGFTLAIGDGFGVLTSLLRMKYPDRKTVTVNLNTPLLIDLTFMLKVLPETRICLPTSQEEVSEAAERTDIDVIALQADNYHLIELLPIRLAMNIHSMQEMNLDVVRGYFDYLRRNPASETVFYCCNRLYKKLYDGEEVRFFDYPWSPQDNHLIDEICPWDNYEYAPKPPFWFKNPHPKQHRLTVLSKNHG
jgi:putative sugar O-methyltransferase